jgi:hypothetical protein
MIIDCIVDNPQILIIEYSYTIMIDYSIKTIDDYYFVAMAQSINNRYTIECPV